ncbi:hypothetical protein Droror1_Dr00020022 [Drosera rotundifolia]
MVIFRDSEGFPVRNRSRSLLFSFDSEVAKPDSVDKAQTSHLFLPSPAFYQNMLNDARCVTHNKVVGIFGFSGEDNIGKAFFSSVQ